MACLMHNRSQKVSFRSLNEQRKEAAMKLITAILAMMMVKATTVLAAGSQETFEISGLMILFLVFGALIIVCQLIPCLVLFYSMLKGLFDSTAKKTLPKAGAKMS
jgi:hypothetical protein